MKSSGSRIALCIEYQGSDFNGWQAQRRESVTTVQETLETALSRVADQTVRVHCAGRTDRGVHANAQIVHFDTDKERPLDAWVRGSNALLPDQVVVRWARTVSKDFHARFTALSRRYCYLIYNHAVPTALLQGLVHWHYRPLNEQKMHTAAQCLIGELDFSSFRGAGCQSNTPMRNVHHVRVTRRGNFVLVDIQANAFLLHMVRNIVGSLLEIGAGDRDPQWLAEVLDEKDRRKAGITAPAAGLYLLEVGYPSEFELPETDSVLSFINSATW
ncbi:MAG: tRNA pseudouridine(38-40) synthase TruA [Gammaproteobacteria bacterium]|nr:tRNA pseudouridine(38-40) synthase TruA [Gammaproteobacteria bacterium]|tara:strand:+ start:123318 stop:124133 length:816 start_codon:yes stop_codon:yes gene_type:complete